jgi:hypothetical protein
MWKRAIITEVRAYGESAFSTSSGVHVRPFVKFRTAALNSLNRVLSEFADLLVGGRVGGEAIQEESDIRQYLKWRGRSH